MADGSCERCRGQSAFTAKLKDTYAARLWRADEAARRCDLCSAADPHNPCVEARYRKAGAIRTIAAKGWLRGADLFGRQRRRRRCTVTSAREPVLLGEWLTAGTHVNAVGASVVSCRELDAECVRRARIWVDYLPMALTSAGELIDALRSGLITEDHIRGGDRLGLGRVCRGAGARRRNHALSVARCPCTRHRDSQLSLCISEIGRVWNPATI